MDAADDQAGDPDLARALHGVSPEEGAPDHDLAFHGGKKVRRGHRLVRRLDRHDQLAPCLAADPENALDHTAASLDRDALPGMDLHHRAVHIRQQFQQARRLAKEHLTRHGGSRLHLPLDRRTHLHLEPFDEGLVLGDHLVPKDRLALLLN